MKFCYRLFPVLAIMLGLFSCDTIPPDQVEKDIPLSFDTLRFERQGGLCEEPGSNCITIKLKYPKAINGKPYVRDSINHFVNQAILDNLIADPDHNYTSIDSAANTMISYYLEELKAMPEYDLAWDVTIDGEAEMVDSFAVISMAAYTYLGGAHPNYYLNFSNYNIHSGKEILLDDIITDMEAFTKLGEVKFGEARTSVYEQTDFDMNEFFFGEGYHLPANFAIKKDGIFLYYNPYEVAAYVLGPTEYLIPYEDLKGMTSLVNNY